MNAELKSKVESYLKNTSGRKTIGRELILELISYIQSLNIDDNINKLKTLEADLKLERESVKRLITSINKLEETKQNQKILISFLFVGIIALALAFIATII